jgi:hypothetical protein
MGVLATSDRCTGSAVQCYAFWIPQFSTKLRSIVVANFNSEQWTK